MDVNITELDFCKVCLLCIEKFDATVWNTKTNLHCIVYVDDAVGNSCHFGCDQCSILRPLVTTIDHRRCQDIVMWFIGKYLPRHKIDITVNHRGLLREGVFGWCTVLDSDSRQEILN